MYSPTRPANRPHANPIRYLPSPPACPLPRPWPFSMYVRAHDPSSIELNPSPTMHLQPRQRSEPREGGSVRLALVGNVKRSCFAVERARACTRVGRDVCMCVPGYVRGLRTVPETRVATSVCGVGRFVCMYVCTYVGMYLAIHTLRIFSTNGHPISAPPPPAMISPFATANPSPRIQRLPDTHTRVTRHQSREFPLAPCV